MFNFGKKNKKEENNNLTWDDQAKQALEQSVNQAPVPAMLKKRMKKELVQAAEANTRAQNSSTVTAQNLMAGLMEKMPAAMRSKVEQAMQKGPEGLKDLEDELK